MTIVYPIAKEGRKQLKPAIHVALIMDYIRKDAVGRYGHHVGSPKQETAFRDVHL